MGGSNSCEHYGAQSATVRSTGDSFADLNQEDRELEKLVQPRDPDTPLSMSEYVATDDEEST